MEDHPFIGRETEVERLRTLVRLLSAGSSAALVIAGEAGAGKTALLRRLESDAAHLRVIAVEGYESEFGWGYAALHRLLAPFLHELDALPKPQREALQTVFGITAGEPPSHFLVGLATLSILENAKSDSPLVCLIDDFQWVDVETQHVLAFVARRLDTQGVAVVLAVRRVEDESALLEGIPSIRLQPMPDADMRSLMKQISGSFFAPDVAGRLVAESAGNPLALIEYVACLEREEFEGPASALPPALPIGARLTKIFGDQIDQLPRDTQNLLLVLAAAGNDADGDVLAAGEGLAISAEAVSPAESSGLISRRPRLRFRHPLLRSAVYDRATTKARRRVHSELARVSALRGHAEKEAWHSACATSGPNESVAAQLEATATLAGQRGGYAARAGFLSLATQRSEDGSQQEFDRLLLAVDAHLIAGNAAEAQRLLQSARPQGPAARRLGLTHAWVHMELNDYRTGYEARDLLRAAADLREHDPDARQAALFRALEVALETRELSVGTTLPAVAQAVLEDAAAATSAEVSPLVGLYEGLATREAFGYAASAPVLRAALTSMRSAPRPSAMQQAALITWLVMEDLWDDEFASTIWEESTRLNYAEGAWPSAWLGLGSSATTHARHGNFEQAQRLYDEAAFVLASMGADQRLLWSVLVEFRAWQGRDAETRSMARTLTHVLGGDLKYGSTPHFASSALAVLDISQGRYSDALIHARKVADADPPGHGSRILSDLVEAATKANDPVTALEALRKLDVRANAAASPWALGVLARCQGLVLRSDRDAEANFRRSLELLRTTRLRTEVGRTQLVYGEWLRRQRRRSEAQVQLWEAHAAFTQMGAAAFAERAAIEVAALGSVVPPTDHHAPALLLTAQETRVAQLAAEGMTNAEISERLFITRSTVDYHMGKIFRKLQITSRRRIKEHLHKVDQIDAGPES